MTQKILAFSGAKQSGKSTRVNFLHGYEMKRNDIIKQFEVNDNGQLIVNAVFTDEKGETTEGMGVLAVDREDFEFATYASQSIWPYVRSYNFATPLKRVCMNVFDLTHEQCYGTDEEKNTHTNIMWKNLPGEPRSRKKVTAREFLQFFGTDICRRIKPDVWTSICINDIVDGESDFAIIGDCRFENEVDAVQEAGGKVIRLTRKPHDDTHESEVNLDNYEGFDFVLDNANMTIDECNKQLLDILIDWRWIESTGAKQFTTKAVKD